MAKKRSLLVVLLFSAVAALTCAAQQSAEPVAKPPLPAQYAATAIGQGGAIAGKVFGLTVYVDSLTSDAEIQELQGILKKNGQDGLVSALEKMKDNGRVAPTSSVGTGIRIVRMRPGKNGGLHILMATDRPMAFGELYNGTRSRDYPIGILVLDVDQDGKGTGSFAPACKVKFNKKGELVIENYGQKPFRLTNVYRQK